jgi:Family of unknown function (DUF5686)/CarboxypepD_reg-like domain
LKLSFKYFVTLILVALLHFSLFAQTETTVKGRVTESGTDIGIPFVNIYYKGTLIGTVTDFDGNYILKTNNPHDSIYVSLIGYKSKAKPVKNGISQTIHFQLSSQVLNLNTIEVRPGVNPALRIVRNAINKKKEYNRNILNSVQYLSYTKQETDINNVGKRMRKWKILKPLAAAFDRRDSLGGNFGKANLPVAMSEILAEIYSYQENDKKHEDVNAIKIKFVGMKDGSALSQLSGTDFLNYNFCENNVAILNKDFLSPIADNAMLFYNYILADSTFIDGKKCYQINCRPKNKRDLAFTGKIWITDTAFAIKQLDLEILKEVNFNLVDHARIQQVLIPTEAGPWVPEQTRVIIDFAIQLKNFISVVQRTYNSNKYYVVNKPKEKEFYNTRITYAEDALLKDTAWWQNSRHEKLTEFEKEAYEIVDTNATNVLYFLFSGYKDIGPIDIGHYINVYGYNAYEGHRLKLGFRTNDKFNKNWIIRGYGAYGFKDKGFKYNLQLERIITRFPWSKAGVQYRNDIDQIGTTFNFSTNINLGQNPNNLYNSASQVGNISKLVRKQEARIWYERDFNRGLSARIIFQNIRTTPLFPVTFGDQFTIFQQRNFSITELLFDGRWSLKERFVQNGNERISFGNNQTPIITLNYTLGLKNVFNSAFYYQKINITFSNRFRMATLGYSQVFLRLGKVFSEVPFTLLDIPRGNQTAFFANNTFNQMNLFEFVSDQYIQAFWQHHFNGLIFNRIPLWNRLDFREVIGLNMVYGSLSEKNKSFNKNNNFTVMDDVPYFEADLGIENILDIIRVDFLYRLTYNDDFYKADYEKTNPGNKINNWGIKIGMQFSF